MHRLSRLSDRNKNTKSNLHLHSSKISNKYTFHVGQQPKNGATKLKTGWGGGHYHPLHVSYPNPGVMRFLASVTICIDELVIGFTGGRH